MLSADIAVASGDPTEVAIASAELVEIKYHYIKKVMSGQMHLLIIEKYIVNKMKWFFL